MDVYFREGKPIQVTGELRIGEVDGKPAIFTSDEQTRKALRGATGTGDAVTAIGRGDQPDMEPEYLSSPGIREIR